MRREASTKCYKPMMFTTLASNSNARTTKSLDRNCFWFGKLANRIPYLLLQAFRWNSPAMLNPQGHGNRPKFHQVFYLFPVHVFTILKVILGPNKPQVGSLLFDPKSAIRSNSFEFIKENIV